MLEDMKKKKIMVCFLPANSGLLQKSWLNSAAARMAPKSDRSDPMVHVELFFPRYEMGDTVGGDSCSIHYGGKVFVANKNFSRKEWLFRSYSCTEQQYDRAREFCNAQKGGRFNYFGYFAPCGMGSTSGSPTLKQQSWYCSELVNSTLVYAGLTALNPDAFTHPDILFEHVVGETYADCGRNINFGNISI